MKRNLRVLYNRIKDYDIESLRQTLELQLGQKKRPVNEKNIFYNHRIKEFSQVMYSRIRFIQRNSKSKRIILEDSLILFPDKTEQLLRDIDQNIYKVYILCIHVKCTPVHFSTSFSRESKDMFF